MEGYAETVGFVAGVLYDFQRFGVLVEVERNVVAGEEDFFEPLCDAYNLHFANQSQFFETSHCKRQLHLATVNNNKLG